MRIGCLTSCNAQCHYQIKCFECPGSQLYSLEQLICVDSCSPDEVEISGSGIHGLKVCRKLEYYVNPLSESILELGTRKYPYKTVNLVLMELFNFLSDIESTITVKISLASYHYLDYGNVLMYNMTNVIFEPYNINLKAGTTSEYGKINMLNVYRLYNQSIHGIPR